MAREVDIAPTMPDITTHMEESVMIGKPDTFVLVVAALSEKLVTLENQRGEMEDHIRADHAEMDVMQGRLTEYSRECESLRDENSNLRTENYNLKDRLYSLESKVRYQHSLEDECARLKEEVLKLKYGSGTPSERVSAYMRTEGERILADGNKILCIKGVKECTGWGLKEAKDYVEAYKPTVSYETPSGTKRSEDLVRKSA
jgi:predicted RNase H-like nuclease (RuvC/YqgF family)